MGLKRMRTSPVDPGAPVTHGGAPEHKRLARGIVLLTLAAEYPDSRVEFALRREVEVGLGKFADRFWAAQLAYLEDKGYIEREQREMRGQVLSSWSITTDGVDLADGNVDPDPGVEINR